MFSSNRLSIARKRRGLTMKALAERVGVTPQAARDFERGAYEPGEATTGKIASELGFPVEFFHGEELDEPTGDGASFRSMSRMTARQRDAALSAGSLAFSLSDYVNERFSLPEPDLLDLQTESPETAVQYLRQHWGLGELPIKNLVHLLESRGVRVFSLAENCKEVDAFSLWRQGVPYIFLNTFKSSERSRFDAAHELGHLVLHSHGVLTGQKVEMQANDFASAFLMPEGQVRAARVVPTLKYLIALKHKWTVSVSALLVRLHRLGLVSDWRYKRLAIEIQQRGFRTNEPEAAPRETSRVWEMVFSFLREDGVGKADIARLLELPVREIENLVFGLVMMGISSPQSKTRRKASGRANHLKLVT